MPRQPAVLMETDRHGRPSRKYICRILTNMTMLITPEIP